MAPNSWYQGAKKIYTGQFTATTTPKPLGINIPCRRILLVAAAAAAVYVVPQGQPITAGFPIPAMSADKSFSYLELWVNNPNVLWIVGAAGNEVVYWVAEEF